MGGHGAAEGGSGRPADLAVAHWRLGLLLSSVFFALVAYRPLLALRPSALGRDIEGWFFQPHQTFPPVVVAMSLWLLYRRRDRWRGLPWHAGAAPLTAALLAAGAAVLAWSTYTGARDLQVPSLMLMALGLASLFKGLAGLRAVLVPVLFLLFALPLPAPLVNHVVFQLQLWTAELTGWLLGAVGETAFVAGTEIFRSGEQFSVIEGCSGLRSTLTLTMMAALMVDLFRRPGLHAALLLIAAPLIAFALNSVRTLALILGPSSDVAAVHNLQGVAILLGGLVALYLLDGLLGRLAPEGHARGREDAPPGSQRPRSAASAALGPWRACAATTVLAGAAAASLWTPVWKAPLAPVPSLTDAIAGELSGWRSERLETDLVFLGSVQMRQRLHRRYSRGGEWVDLFVGVADRGLRVASPFSPKTALPGAGWIVEERGTATLEPGGREVGAQVIRAGARRRLVYHWYQGTRGLGNEVVRSLLALDASPLRRPGAALVVRLSTGLEGRDPASRGDAEGRLRRFFEALRERLALLDHRRAWKSFSPSGQVCSP